MQPEEEEEEDGANVDLDSQRRGKCVVLKTSTRQTIFLPVVGLVDADALKPADLVGVNKARPPWAHAWACRGGGAARWRAWACRLPAGACNTSQQCSAQVAARANPAALPKWRRRSAQQQRSGREPLRRGWGTEGVTALAACLFRTRT